MSQSESAATHSKGCPFRIDPDGSMYGIDQWIYWSPPCHTVTLDGEFSASDLRQIAAWMEAHYLPHKEVPHG
jgi:hypothetical protein